MALALTIGVPLVAGAGWFLLAWLAVHEPAGDAAGEGLGVAFGVLIVVSVIGTVRSRREQASSDSGEDPERPS